MKRKLLRITRAALPFKVKNLDGDREHYYGFAHEAVFARFNVDRYVGTFCIGVGGYWPFAVYFSKNPDVSKGHKPYVLLSLDSLSTSGLRTRGILVSGMTTRQMGRWRKQEAILCLRCKTVIVSAMRHHDNSCLCEKDPVSVDGGRSYVRIGAGDTSRWLGVMLDWVDGSIYMTKKDFLTAKRAFAAAVVPSKDGGKRQSRKRRST